MKFGIITLVSDNYGNKYQNYAVEKILSEYGDVETYGLKNLYQPPLLDEKTNLEKWNPAYIREVLISRLMYQYDINRVDKGVIYNLMYAKIHRTHLLKLKNKRSERFRKFSVQNLHISKTVLDRHNVTKEWIDGIDFFICGSDQIWNPFYVTTSELAFCSFAPEKTVCLSPSFGVSEIPEYRKEEYAKSLTSIKYLSVRENTGQKIIKKLTGRNATVLLDPTMALPVKKWEELCKAPRIKLPKNYIACYFLGKIDKDYRKKINKFAKKTKLPVVMLFDITTPEYYVFDPTEVLYTIKNAEYVLTDSFHGSVFSILFHKNFNVFSRNEGGASMNSRIETLLGKFGLEKQTQLNEKKLTTDRWIKVERILLEERKKTIKYLEEAINGNN